MNVIGRCDFLVGLPGANRRGKHEGVSALTYMLNTVGPRGRCSYYVSLTHECISVIELL